MREYETTFIVQPEISDEGICTVRDRLDAVLAKHDAVRLFYDDQGRRRLAYEIGKFQKGHYITLSFLDEGKVVPELERELRLDDSVLRFLTVQVLDEVSDIEARKAEAAELERVREQKAAERAAREAEEAARAAELAAAEAEAKAKADTEAAAKAKADTEAAAKAEVDTEAAAVAEVAAGESVEGEAAARVDPAEDDGAGSAEETRKEDAS